MPTAEELDELPTAELRDRAFARAREAHDLRFFWDLVKHLPAAAALSGEEASTGEITGSLSEVMELGHEWTGSDLGDQEPLVRARFITYLQG